MFIYKVVKNKTGVNKSQFKKKWLKKNRNKER